MTTPLDTGPLDGEIGPIARLPRDRLVEAARLVREGRTYSLAATRYPGMPLFPGHPPFQAVSYTHLLLGLRRPAQPAPAEPDARGHRSLDAVV